MQKNVPVHRSETRQTKNRLPMIIEVLSGICKVVWVNTQQATEKPLFISLIFAFSKPELNVSAEHISILPPENHEIRSWDLRSKSVQTFVSLSNVCWKLRWCHADMLEFIGQGEVHARKANKYLPFYWDVVYLSTKRGKWWLPWLPKRAAFR